VKTGRPAPPTRRVARKYPGVAPRDTPGKRAAKFPHPERVPETPTPRILTAKHTNYVELHITRNTRKMNRSKRMPAKTPTERRSGASVERRIIRLLASLSAFYLNFRFCPPKNLVADRPPDHRPGSHLD
jgi:hypothetical protein